MPLARYFLFVGAALLALLFISDAYLPKLPVADRRADADLPVIRINSERKWPAPVVFDTSHPPLVAMAAMSPPAVVPTQPPTPEMGHLAKARILDAFAQLQPTNVKVADVKKTDAKPEARPQPKRKIAKKHVGPPTVLVAQRQPQFGFFGSNFFASNTW